MKSSNIVSWIIAVAPLVCVVYMFCEIAEAIHHFGHFPEYLVDPDPFHTKWKTIFPDAGSFVFFPLPFFLMALMPALAIPPIRYTGKRKLLFYTFVSISIVITALLVFNDPTGYINWSLD